MLDTYTAVNKLNGAGQPAGGNVDGTGLVIVWQNGPLGRGSDRKTPNGAFVETVIDAVVQRITHYQKHSPCEENAYAISRLTEALAALDARTKRREIAGIEGTHGKD